MAKKQASRSISTTSPIGGLNARDSLAAMPPQDAVILDNFFPTPTTVDLRKGYIKWATGLPSHVESLMSYKSATASKIFAASGTEIYDVTVQGAVGTAVVTGLTNARFQHANFGTPGGQFLYLVNGVDKPRLYNGSTWTAIDGASTPAITGVTTTSLIHLNVYKNRLFFIEKDSMSAWYLPINSIAGTASELDFSSMFKLGGYLAAMATWTIDNSAGIQEYAVFISSEGEVAVYQGADPGDANSWSVVGVFRIGHPVGRRCFAKVGSDVIIIGADGFIPLSKALLTDRSQTQEAISTKILNLVNEDVAKYGTTFGWEPCLFPIGNKFIINVPEQANKLSYQYVMNTVTSAWCKFKGWNANCFLVDDDRLFFGGNYTDSNNKGYVARADYLYSDDGAFIQGEVKTAFQYFGAPGLLKRFTMVRPIFNTAGTMNAALNMDVDFDNKPPTATPTFFNTGGTKWDTAKWNTFQWFGGFEIKKNWQGVNGVGYSGALHMKIVHNIAPVQWMSIDYVFETGNIL